MSIRDGHIAPVSTCCPHTREPYKTIFGESEEIRFRKARKQTGYVKYHLGARGKELSVERDHRVAHPNPVISVCETRYFRCPRACKRRSAETVDRRERGGSCLHHVTRRFPSEGVVAETFNISRSGLSRLWDTPYHANNHFCSRPIRLMLDRRTTPSISQRSRFRRPFERLKNPGDVHEVMRLGFEYRAKSARISSSISWAIVVTVITRPTSRRLLSPAIIPQIRSHHHALRMVAGVCKRSRLPDDVKRLRRDRWSLRKDSSGTSASVVRAHCW